jgi:3-oxoadipate enol-lactonase
MPTASAGLTELQYFRRGSGPPLLLIMGMSGSYLHWGEPFVSELERDFEVIAYNHRGVGGSSWVTEPFTTNTLAQDAAGLLDALELQSAHVLGISMGGMVAQQLALAHPGRVSTLTLGGTYCGGPGSVLTSGAVVGRLTQAFMSGDRERALRTTWEVNVSAAMAADDHQYARFRALALEMPVAISVIMAQMRACAEHDTSQRLRELDVASLVVHGTVDLMLPVENGRMIADLIPGARLAIFEGVGHLFFWEEPQRSAALVRELARSGVPSQ